MSDKIPPDAYETLRQIALSNSLDDEQLNQHIEDLLGLGFPSGMVLKALEGSDWRYVVENSGREISVAGLHTLLSWYQELLEQAALHIEDLYDLGDAYVPARALLKQLDAREQAGAACHTVALESIRLARFLRPEDDLPDAGRDIGRRLEPIGLKWDGEYELEAWPGENESLHQRVAEMLATKTPERCL